MAHRAPSGPGLAGRPSLLLDPHRLGQRDPASVQPRLHGADRHAHDGRHLLLPEVVDVVQDHHRAEVLGHLQQRLLHVHRQARRVGVVRSRRRLSRGQVVLATVEQGCPLALAQQVVAGVDRHAVEPGRERGLAAERRELAEHREERVLGRVARVLLSPRHAEGEVVDASLVAFDQRGERGSISRQVPADEVFVAGRRVRHRPPRRRRSGRPPAPRPPRRGCRRRPARPR